MIPKYGLNHQEKGMEFRQEAFTELKQKLTQTPILIQPIWDPGYTFVVHTDARGNALGYYCSN